MGCLRRTLHGLAALSALAFFGCGGEADPNATDTAPEPGGAVTVADPPDAGELADASPADPVDDDAASPQADAGPPCTKELTVIASVGTGAGALRGHSNGCWSVIDADGAANDKFRKCSTSNHLVKNAAADNYAYDDTNPNAPLSQDQAFLQQCSSGASGDGYEFMAYRGSWRLLAAPHLRAYFAELYGGGVDDVDSFWFQKGAYRGNAQLAGKNNVYPMINVGPRASSKLEGKIGKDALAICRTVKNHGYFGTYVATYTSPMPADDPRVLALAGALNACTR